METATAVLVEEVALCIIETRRMLLELGIDMTIGDKQILPAIAIVVKKTGGPAKIGTYYTTQTGSKRSLYEAVDTLVSVKGIDIVGEIGDVNVEIAVGNLPSAINIPLRELEQRLGGLSRRREIVAYCRGPYCVLSFKAVAALRGRGFKVRRLVEGSTEW